MPQPISAHIYEVVAKAQLNYATAAERAQAFIITNQYVAPVTIYCKWLEPLPGRADVALPSRRLF